MIRTLLAALLLAPMAMAQTAQDRAAMEGRVAEFDAAFRAGDMAAVVGMTPPEMIDVIAAEAQVDPADLRLFLVEQSVQLMQDVAVVEFEMNTGAATGGTTPQGRPYYVIPTLTVVETGGEELRTQTDTVAFENGGRWWLVRVNDATQADFLARTFPDLRDIPLGFRSGAASQ